VPASPKPGDTRTPPPENPEDVAALVVISGHADQTAETTGPSGPSQPASPQGSRVHERAFRLPPADAHLATSTWNLGRRDGGRGGRVRCAPMVERVSVRWWRTRLASMGSARGPLARLQEASSDTPSRPVSSPNVSSVGGRAVDRRVINVGERHLRRFAGDGRRCGRAGAGRRRCRRAARPGRRWSARRRLVALPGPRPDGPRLPSLG
jgi:hypothetical protein